MWAHFFVLGTSWHIAGCLAFLPTATTKCQWLPRMLSRQIPTLVGGFLPPGELLPSASGHPFIQVLAQCCSPISFSSRERPLFLSLHTFVIPPGSPSDLTHHTLRALLTCPSPHPGSQESLPFTIEPQDILSAWHTVGTQMSVKDIRSSSKSCFCAVPNPHISPGSILIPMFQMRKPRLKEAR